MSGNCTGVQQRIKKVSPGAVYIHCYAHVLNLVLVDCTKKVQLAHDFFCTLEALYVFISTSKADEAFISTQNELYPESQSMNCKDSVTHDGHVDMMLSMTFAALMIHCYPHYKKFQMDQIGQKQQKLQDSQHK